MNLVYYLCKRCKSSQAETLVPSPNNHNELIPQIKSFKNAEIRHYVRVLKCGHFISANDPYHSIISDKDKNFLNPSLSSIITEDELTEERSKIMKPFLSLSNPGKLLHIEKHAKVLNLLQKAAAKKKYAIQLFLSELEHAKEVHNFSPEELIAFDHLTKSMGKYETRNAEQKIKDELRTEKKIEKEKKEVNTAVSSMLKIMQKRNKNISMVDLEAKMKAIEDSL